MSDNQDYRKTHLADFARNQKKYRQTHREQVNAYSVLYRKRNFNRFKIIEFLGNRCCVCGFSNQLALQIDHINGGGTQEYKKFGGHIKMIKYYLDHLNEAKQKLQVLCSNCNLIKKYNNKEFGKKFMI